MVSSAISSLMQVAYLFFDQFNCSCTAIWQSWTWSLQILHPPFTLPCKSHYVYLRWLFELCTKVSFLSCQKSSLNQLTCISIWGELCGPTFIPLVMGLVCPSQLQGHLHFSQTTESIAYFISTSLPFIACIVSRGRNNIPR